MAYRAFCAWLALLTAHHFGVQAVQIDETHRRDFYDANLRALGLRRETLTKVLSEMGHIMAKFSLDDTITKKCGNKKAEAIKHDIKEKEDHIVEETHIKDVKSAVLERKKDEAEVLQHDIGETKESIHEHQLEVIRLKGEKELGEKQTKLENEKDQKEVLTQQLFSELNEENKIVKSNEGDVNGTSNNRMEANTSDAIEEEKALIVDEEANLEEEVEQLHKTEKQIHNLEDSIDATKDEIHRTEKAVERDHNAQGVKEKQDELMNEKETNKNLREIVDENDVTDRFEQAVVNTSEDLQEVLKDKDALVEA